MKTIDVTWTELKSFVDNGRFDKLQYVTVNGRYHIIGTDGWFSLETSIKIESPASDDQTDFETNYLPSANQEIDLGNAIISSGNSTTTPLGIGAEFTGDWEECLGYSNISITLSSDVASAVDGIIVEWSTDGVNVDNSDPYTVVSPFEDTLNFGVITRYYRVRYINGSTAQSFFRLQTILHTFRPKPSTHRIDSAINGENDAELTKAVLTGKDPNGTFVNVPSSGVLDSNSSTTPLLAVGTASGDRVVRQTRKYFRYQVARTHYKTYVGILGASKTGVVTRIGSYDASDGILFKQSERGLSVVRRDSTSGSLVDVEVDQADWNIDPLDGTGPSGITLDPTKLMIYGDKFNWHGGGPIIMGIYFNGRFNACHSFETNNTSTTPVMSLPNLPIRYEIENISATASATSMYQGASSAVIDGGVEIDQSLSFSANNGNTTRTASTTTPIPIIAIRPKATFEGRTNRTSLVPVSFNVQASDGVLVEIYTSGTITGGTWTSVSPQSTAEVNRGGTSISGGRLLESLYIPASVGAAGEKVDGSIVEDLFMTLDIDGANPENIAIVVTSLSGSPTVLGSINWRESY